MKTVDKLHISKIKNLCSVTDTVKRLKGQATDWQKIFTGHLSDT